MAQILAYGHVRAGTTVLTVDAAMGMLVGAVAERMAGHGRVLGSKVDELQAGVGVGRAVGEDEAVLRIRLGPSRVLSQGFAPRRGRHHGGH